MEVYLRAFVNMEQDNWAKLLLYPNLLIIIRKTLALIIRLLNLTLATILESLMKKILIFTCSQNQQTNKQLS